MTKSKAVELSTKARTLEALSSVVKNSTVMPLFYFSVSDWKDADKIVKQAFDTLGADIRLIVRSSAKGEDSATESMAGAYESILNVKGAEQLKAAINEVIASYGKAGADDEVLVQPMIENVSSSGVVFSHDPSTKAPYRVVNYVTGDDTTAVTSGSKSASGYVITKGRCSDNPLLQGLVDMVDELETLCGDTPLDMEFAFQEGSHKPILLQARPLILAGGAVEDVDAHQKTLERISKRVKSLQKPHPFLHGKSTVFGVMPDWNPAEIIGIRPRPLALSLYRELVTDAIWAYQRHNYGYRNLRSFPLLLHFGGLPYIDVRVSFNSFIPNRIDEKLADRLVDYYIDRLVDAPALHDKVEFEVVFSCYTLDLPERLEKLSEYGFVEREQEELTNSLRDLTNKIICNEQGLWKQDAAKIERLKERRNEIMSSGMGPVSRIYWLLEDIKRYGTLPFAGLARAGFIAVQMLQSMISVGVLSKADYDSFMNGLNTVSTQLSSDLSKLDRASFLNKYGHLRPGTYDVLSPRYDETPDEYLGADRQEDVVSNENHEPFRLSLQQMKKIAALLSEHGLSADVVSLFDFLQAGIEQREYAKFVFTKSLSDALSIFTEWGAGLGFSKEDLSYADIGCVYELYTSADNPEETIARSIAEGKEKYKTTSQIWLPPLIVKPEDVYSFELNEAEPNFITQNSVTADVSLTRKEDKLKGKIVFISSADPGYDWVFSHDIAGLVTAYGGANSHMAIRANELGLPAVIGAGEVLFKRWSAANKLFIDCASRKVEILS